VFQPRVYRHWVTGNDLVSFNVVVRETDLLVRARANLKRKALRLVNKYREILERYIAAHPQFQTSLEPVEVAADAPRLVREMAAAARKAGVGPMASVAGAIAEFVGTELLALSPELLIENGGDIFMQSVKKRLIGIYAGASPLSGQIALETPGDGQPLGIGTSSGTVGHSMSFGRADAAILLSSSAPLADAAATAVGNRVIQAADIPAAIEFAKSIEGITGVLIIKGDRMGAWGEVKIVPLAEGKSL